MPANKVGDNIYITGLGNTLASVTTDINDITWIEKVGSSPDIYEVKGTHDLDIRPDGELIIGNSGDYSFDETLQFAPTAFNSISFYVRSLGSLKCYGNIKINFSTTSYYIAAIIYGGFESYGDVTYQPLYYRMNSWTRLFETTDYDSYLSDGIICEYSKFWTRTSGEGLQGFATIIWNPIVLQPNEYYYKCEFDGNHDGLDAGGQGRGRAPYITSLGSTRSNSILLEECILQRFDNVFNFGTYAPWYKNCIHRYNDTAGIIYNPRSIQTDYTYAIDWGNVQGTSGQWMQSIYCIDGATVYDNNNASLNSAQGGVVLLKNCDFQDTGAGNINVYQNGFLLIWTGNTFAADRPVGTSKSPGLLAYVFALDLTIEDTDSNPVEGATVLVEQSAGRERWIGITGVDGKVITQPEIGKIILVNREWLSGSLSGGSYDYWSDGSPEYHIITVSAPGYVTQVANINMTSDRTLTMQLSGGGPPPSPVTAKVVRLTSPWES